MKSFAVALFVSLTVLSASADTGFICPKENLKISKLLLAGNTSTIAIEHADRKIDTNPLLIVPEGKGNDTYQERFGTYNEIRANTVNFMPYGPEFLMVFRMMIADPLYLKGFRTLDGEGGEPVKLKSLYCRALVESIQHYKP